MREADKFRLSIQLIISWFIIITFGSIVGMSLHNNWYVVASHINSILQLYLIYYYIYKPIKKWLT